MRKKHTRHATPSLPVRLLRYLKALVSPVDRGSDSAELIDTMRIFNAIFLIRVLGLIANIVTLPFRENLPEPMRLSFQYAFYPLFAYNIILFLAQKKIYELLRQRRWWVLVDIAVSVGVLFIGAGWRSSYFLYTVSTVALGTLFAQTPGTVITCLALGLVALFKDPNIYGNDYLIFNATNLDMRLGASIAYVVIGLILGYFNHLLKRLQKLSQEKVAAVRQQTAAEQRMQLAADLHDNIKSKITAILLLYRPLLQSYLGGRKTSRAEFLKLWNWLNYLQEDTLKMFTSLKHAGKDQARNRKVDLADIIREELRIMADITDFRWSFHQENGSYLVPAVHLPPLRRFLGEAALNAWKHSGVREGVIGLTRRNGEIKLSVQDRGKGFDRTGRRQAGPHGLKSMKRRAEELNGRLTIDTGPGRGVTLILAFPAKTGKK